MTYTYHVIDMSYKKLYAVYMSLTCYGDVHVNDMVVLDCQLGVFCVKRGSQMGLFDVKKRGFLGILGVKWPKMAKNRVFLSKILIWELLFGILPSK